MLVAGGAVVLLAGSSSEDDSGGGDGDGGAEPDRRSAEAELVMAPRELVLALQDERAAATIGLLGLTGAVELPVADGAAARRQTDAAVAEFEAVAAAEPAYQDALAALPAVTELRSELDGRTQPPGLSEAPYARQVHDRYSEAVTALLDAQTQVVAGIDDPELRRGASLSETALRQVELVSQLSQEVLAVPTAQGTSESVRVMAGLRGELERGRSFVMSSADGAYADAAGRLDAVLAAAGSLDAVDTALSTGQVDLPALLGATDAMGQGWRTFLDEIQVVLARGG